MYCFLVRCNILACFSGLALVSSWQANINNMLRSIPTIIDDDDDNNDNDNDDENLNAYFDAIDAKLTIYENMSKAPMLLELVIQKNEIVRHGLSFF
jgi:hypothetical protein